MIEGKNQLKSVSLILARFDEDSLEVISYS